MFWSRAIWWSALTCLVGVGCIVFLHFRCRLIFKREKLPPGRIGWPLIGETISFLKSHPSTSTGTFLQNHCKRFGKIFTSHVFGEPTIVSCDPDLNFYILQNEDRLFQCSYPKPIHGILGELSMLVIVGDAHKLIRSLALSMINNAKTSNDFLNDIERNAVLVFDQWSHKQHIMFCDHARKFTFNVIVKQILSLQSDNPQTSQILSDFLSFMKGLVSILPINIPFTPYSRAVKSKSRIFATVKTIIDERKKDHNQRGDFLDSLITNGNLREKEIQSLVLDLLLAGYETTSTLIALVLQFLTHCPKVMQELKNEHEAIKRAKLKDEWLTFDDYNQMSFTQKVFDEALRLGNVVKFVHRKALKQVKFKEYNIPAGWKVLPILSAVHLDSSNYHNPSEFNPWRWQMQAAGNKFLPFGGGTRLCPGYELARIEAAFFFHHLILKFRWRITQDDQSMAYPYVEFKKGFPIQVERCSTSNELCEGKKKKK